MFHSNMSKKITDIDELKRESIAKGFLRYRSDFTNNWNTISLQIDSKAYNVHYKLRPNSLSK